MDQDLIQKNKETDTEQLPSNLEERLEHLSHLVDSAYNNLDKIKSVLRKMEQDAKRNSYRNIPGIEGIFDGVAMVSDDGTKHDVPPNYAAKSRLVIGDRLKMVDEDGKKLFKQIDKVPRKQIKGIAGKKEGKWYIISDIGSFRISDVAATFNKLELNQEIEAIVPENFASATYAAFDGIVGQMPVEDKKEVKIDRKPFVPKLIKTEKPITPKPETAKIEKSEKKPVVKTEAKPAPKVERKPFVPKVTKPAEAAPAPVKREEKKMEQVQTLMPTDDDDLM